MKTNIKFTNKVLLALILTLSFSTMSFTEQNEPPKGPAFALENEHSTLLWKGNKPGGSHYGVVDVINGKVLTNGTDITGGSFTIEMGSIIVQDLENKKFNSMLRNHLLSEDFFDVEKYPNAFFKITSVEEAMAEDENGFKTSHILNGDLTIKGVSNAISFPVKIDFDENLVHAKTSEIVLDRTLWNVNHMSKSVFADLKNKYVDDEMIVSLDLRFEVE